MKAELRFENGGVIVLVTDMITGQIYRFGPYGLLEAEAILRDYDRMRAMVLEVRGG